MSRTYSAVCLARFTNAQVILESGNNALTFHIPKMSLSQFPFCLKTICWCSKTVIERMRAEWVRLHPFYFNSVSEKWSQCWSALKLHSFYWPAGFKKESNCIEIYEKMFLLLTSFSKVVPNDFMVLISCFKSSSTQHDVHLVNYGPI